MMSRINAWWALGPSPRSMMVLLAAAGAALLVRWQIATLTKALGHTDFRQLSRDDLVALTPEAAAITGLPYDPTYRAKSEELLTKVA